MGPPNSPGAPPLHLYRGVAPVTIKTDNNIDGACTLLALFVYHFITQAYFVKVMLGRSCRVLSHILSYNFNVLACRPTDSDESISGWAGATPRERGHWGAPIWLLVPQTGRTRSCKSRVPAIRAPQLILVSHHFTSSRPGHGGDRPRGAPVKGDGCGAAEVTCCAYHESIAEGKIKGVK